MIHIGPYLPRFWDDTVIQCSSTHEHAMIKSVRLEKKDKPIIVIYSILATMEDETKEDWMMDPNTEDNTHNINHPEPRSE